MASFSVQPETNVEHFLQPFHVFLKIWRYDNYVIKINQQYVPMETTKNKLHAALAKGHNWVLKRPYFVIKAVLCLSSYINSNCI